LLRRGQSRVVVGLAGAAIVAAAIVGTESPVGANVSASEKRAAVEPHLDSAEGAVSADGRSVAFSSMAPNLVPGANAECVNRRSGRQTCFVFVRDRVAGATSRVSVGAAGEKANGDSGLPAVSASGRFVAFESAASNLVPGDTNGASDVFVHDRATGATTRVSVTSGGAQANGGSFDPAISADGRFVAFNSDASKLVSGDTNGKFDVFVHDRVARRTTLVSGGGRPSPNSFDAGEPSISASGRFVAFVSDAYTTGEMNVFVRDRSAGKTTLVSASRRGRPGNDWSFAPSISANGRFVAFSVATDLVAPEMGSGSDVFVRDLAAKTTTLVSVSTSGKAGNDESGAPAISANGRFVAFSSHASDLVAGDTNRCQKGRSGYTNCWDVFVRDLVLGRTTRVSVSSSGAQANGISEPQLEPAISADGRFVVFSSKASNLVRGDTNRSWDVFLRDRRRGTTELVSVAR
jgi:Tol biopolymer transport system component